MLSPPVVSVLTIAGTGRRHLHDALRSLVRQTFAAWESIVLDCGSEAMSKVVQAQVAKVGDDRICTVRRDFPVGFPPRAAAKWNFSATIARGTILAFLDDDDMKEDDWLERMVAPLLAEPHLVATISGGYCIDESGARGGRLFGEPSLRPEILLAPNFITTGQICVRKTVFDEIGGFDEALLCAEDWEFCIRLSKHLWTYVAGASCLKRDAQSNACYHPEVAKLTQDALRRTIRKHGLAPDQCHGCGASVSTGDEPFVWAVPGLGFRLWHYDCAVARQKGTG